MALPRPASGELSAPQVSFGWGEWGVRTLAPDAEVVVVVDVLSFSTTVTVACSRGARVLPHGFDDDDDADRFAAEHGAVLAVHRDRESASQPYSLSPVSMLAAGPSERIVLPSPNGATLSLLAARSGAEVVAGCLRNAAAVARHVEGRPVAVIAAGERWPDGSLRPAIEDLIGAGVIIAGLEGDRSPEAEAAVLAAGGDVGRLVRGSISGRELAERHAAEDVEMAVAVDADDAVPVLTGGAYVAAP